MAFGLRAAFPLGYYQGHDRYGEPEPYPHLTRVHSALIDAAYSCARLQERNAEELELVDGASALPVRYAKTLRWLESNPPDALVLPEARMSDTATMAYRRTGAYRRTDKSDASNKSLSTLPFAAVARSSLSGPVEWWWNSEPSSEVAEVLGELAFEVPYLGEVESVVRLTAINNETLPEDGWNRVCASGVIDGATGIFQYAPEDGRLDGVQESFVSSRMSSKNKQGQSGTDEVMEPVFYNFEKRYYFHRAKAGACAHLPWGKGYLMDVAPSSDGEAQWPPSDDRKLAWAVALHRALVRKCGDDPPLILKHRKGCVRAGANGVAIHIVDEAMPLAQGLNAAGAAFLVMLPFDAPADEAYAVERAIKSVRRIYGRGLGALDIAGTPRDIDSSKLWRDCEDEMERWWYPSPLWVADNRPPTGRDGEAWTLADSVRVSIGYVFREAVQGFHVSTGETEPPSSQTHDERLRRLSRDVDAMGVKIAGARLLCPNRPGDYLHHMNKGSFFSAGTFLCNLGTLGGGTAALAVGQTRHLGGGLLVPVDIPAAPAASMLRGGE